MRQTEPVGSVFAKKIKDLDEAAFQALYGRWDPPSPAQVAALLAGSGARWWIAGGRAARAGAPPRQHDDTDIAVRLSDLDGLRTHLGRRRPGRQLTADVITLRQLTGQVVLIARWIRPGRRNSRS